MASNDDRRLTDKDSIALLRRLRAGGGDDDAHFVVHRVDVCDAPPEVLVADLEPVPGTGVDDDGHSGIWYFYHAKKFTNKQGKLSGYRQRKVTDGGGAYWHSEIGAKDVQGSGGGTSCTFSYGRKTNPSARSIHRLGWCMTEYDIADADKQHEDEAADDSSNFVLCKVYRSPRTKEKSASTSSSSKKPKTTKKRKAGGGDHPEAPPAKSKSIQQQEQEQVQREIAYYQPQPQPQPQPQDVQEVAVQQPAGPGGDFNFNIEDINFYVDESMLRDEPPVPEQGLQLQQPIAAEPEHDDGRFIQLPCGPVLAAEAATVVGDIPVPETAVQRQRGAESEHQEFTVERLLRGQPQQPIVETPPGHGDGEFIQMPWGPVVPVVAEAAFDDMLLGLDPETMYGQWSGSMTTSASIPWSSNAYVPTSSSSYAGCSSLLQGRSQLPYLMC